MLINSLNRGWGTQLFLSFSPADMQKFSKIPFHWVCSPLRILALWSCKLYQFLLSSLLSPNFSLYEYFYQNQILQSCTVSAHTLTTVALISLFLFGSDILLPLWPIFKFQEFLLYFFLFWLYFLQGKIKLFLIIS